MFRNVRVEGDIKIFSYDNRPLLVSINDAYTQREYKFKDVEYLNSLHQNIGFLTPGLFNIKIHPITVLSDSQIIRVQYVNKFLYEEVVIHDVQYDEITENIFDSIINWEYINCSDTGTLMR